MDWGIENDEETWSDDDKDEEMATMTVADILVLLISGDLLPTEDTKRLVFRDSFSFSPDETLATLFFDDIPPPSNQLLTDALIHFVSKNEYLKISEFLRLSPVDANNLWSNGDLAVHRAKSVEALKRLRQGGANLLLENDEKNSPLSLALRSGNSRMASYILSFAEDEGSLINQPSTKQSGYLEILEYFLRIFENNDMDNQGIHTTLRLFKMSLTSFNRFGLKASESDRETALSSICKAVNSKEISESAVYDAIYDQYPADIGKLFEEIISSLLSESPGVFDEPESNNLGAKAGANSPPSPEKTRRVMEVERNFEHLDHTADIQIHSWGNTLEEAFESAVLGMFDYSVPLEKVDPRKMIIIDSRAKKGSDLKDILFLVMQDCLYEAATDPYFMAREAKVLSLDREKCSCKMQLKGEEFDLQKHGGFGTEVKAVTHSALNIIETEKKSEVWVIVDI